MLSGVLQSSDAMTEAMSSTGLWRGGGVGGRKRMWLPAVRAGVCSCGGFVVVPERGCNPSESKLCNAKGVWSGLV